MAEEAVTVAPKMERIVFPARLSGRMEEISEKIAKMPFYAIDAQQDSLTIARIESRNIHKMPYLFYIIIMEAEKVTVIYSVPQDSSENLRRATILKNLASLASLIADQYTINEETLLQYVDSTLDNIINSLSQSYSSILNKYDSLLTDYRAIKRLNLELSSSNRNLTIQSTQLSEESKRLGEQLKKLQTYSDEALMAMVQDWIEVHNESMDIPEFSKTYSIAAPRVEEILDKMVSLGYLELKG